MHMLFAENRTSTSERTFAVILVLLISVTVLYVISWLTLLRAIYSLIGALCRL